MQAGGVDKAKMKMKGNKIKNANERVRYKIKQFAEESARREARSRQNPFNKTVTSFNSLSSFDSNASDPEQEPTLKAALKLLKQGASDAL